MDFFFQDELVFIWIFALYLPRFTANRILFFRKQHVYLERYNILYVTSVEQKKNLNNLSPRRGSKPRPGVRFSKASKSFSAPKSHL